MKNKLFLLLAFSAIGYLKAEECLYYFPDDTQKEYPVPGIVHGKCKPNSTLTFEQVKESKCIVTPVGSKIMQSKNEVEKCLEAYLVKESFSSNLDQIPTPTPITVPDLPDVSLNPYDGW